MGFDFPTILSVAIDLPDVPIGGAAAAACSAANALHNVNDTLIHPAASPKRLRVNAPRMSAKPAGHLDVVPGSQITDTDPVPAFGEDDDVPILFHHRMLGTEKRPASIRVFAWKACKDRASYHGAYDRQKKDVLP